MKKFNLFLLFFVLNSLFVLGEIFYVDVNPSIPSYKNLNEIITGNWVFTGLVTFSNLSVTNYTSISYINSSDYWDDLDTPADIDISELNNDAGYITGAEVSLYETDSAHNECSEIAGCVEGALTSESDPQVGTLINGKWCKSDGSQTICIYDAPSGTGTANITAYVQYYSAYSENIIENMSFITVTDLIDYAAPGNEYVRGVI